MWRKLIDWRRGITYPNKFKYELSFYLKPRPSLLQDIAADIKNGAVTLPISLERVLNAKECLVEEKNFELMHETETEYETIGLHDSDRVKLLLGHARFDIEPAPLIQYLTGRVALNLIGLSVVSNSKWDNDDSLGAYKYHGGLKTFYDPELNLSGKSVDVSNRPGRKAFTKDFIWMGGHEFWIKAGALNLSKDYLLAFSDAEQVKLLPNDIIHIKLMPPSEYWSDAGQERLASLRAYLHIDENSYQL